MDSFKGFVFAIGLLLLSAIAQAGVDSSIVGNVTDSQGTAVANASVRLLSPGGQLVDKRVTSMTGEFTFFPVVFGTYQVLVEATGFESLRLTASVASSSVAQIDAHLIKSGEKEATPMKEYVINVKEKKNLIQSTTSGSKTNISKEQIKAQPGGENVSLPKLLSSTTPGVVQGPWGQMFIRGNHANVQYQIDGVQLPDSMSGTFGDAFSLRNVDHMEVITGGVPAEYGERLAAIMNIVTKTGPESPEGSADFNYGSYNTFNPQLTYGGSDSSGRFRYYLTANYLQTNRGLDTPQPKSYTDQSQGGSEVAHDKATSNDQFMRFDWILDNEDKFTVNLYNSSRWYQIPNFPSSFQKGDAYFGGSYADNFGNTGTNAWTPSNTDDSQTEQNAYLELVWKKTFSEHSFLQIAPYYKRSALKVSNDPTNDLPPVGGRNSSFAMDRSVDNFGLKTDYTLRLNEQNLLKSGFQIQQSNGAGSFSLQTDSTQPKSVYGTPDHGTMEAVYIQDSYSISKPLTLNAGLRYSATQFNSEGLSTQDGLLQPRLGLEYLLTQSTKLHAFYGKLFQPAPFEDLRSSFATNGGSASPYDVKAEKDDYYEVGVAQQMGDNHLVNVSYYYKNATDMLDDSALANTSIAQPYNFAHGYATGIELSITGSFASHWSDFFNYAYEDARGQGISGGTFTVPVDTNLSAPYQFLDHVQFNTANAGITYKTDSYWTTLQGLYGSGLRTGPGNSGTLPSHTTFDFTAGYSFHDQDQWLKKWRVSVDVLNLLDNAYPITIANGYNGNHYAAGREFFIRLAKEL